MKLFEYSISRSIRCRWLLEEMEIPFESITVDLSKGEHLKAEFLAINPCAKVPALLDGDLILFESAAICQYIADKYPEKGFIPQVGTKARALHDQWMFYCMAELEQPIWTIAKHTFVYDEEKRSPQAIELAKEDFREIVQPLEKHMQGRKFLVGDAFQAADVMVAQTLIWAFAMRTTKHLDLLADCPALVSYLRDISVRPKMPEALRSILAERLKNI